MCVRPDAMQPMGDALRELGATPRVYGRMPKASALLLQPPLHLRDGRIIRSIADAIALLREHEARPGVDARDEVLHQLERAPTDEARSEAAKAFVDWANELEFRRSPRPERRISSHRAAVAIRLHANMPIAFGLRLRSSTAVDAGISPSSSCMSWARRCCSAPFGS